jgi:hypothetical protein
MTDIPLGTQVRSKFLSRFLQVIDTQGSSASSHRTSRDQS